ncbi:MAG: hypothetical protein GYA17_20465 [Chloroflexi bacterium]|nr:hypothetical protein [Anaerolineaceae bacterium]NMB90740.1 hypothetical protein [Chloroflexota bacterium]
MKLTKGRWIIVTLSLLVLLACSLPFGGTAVNTQGTQEAESLKETGIALGIQSTMLSYQVETSQAQSMLLTLEASQPTATQQPTNTPEPTATALPTATPAVEAAVASEPTAAPEVDLKKQIQQANILVFEDIRGYPDLEPRVQRAIQTMDFSGGKIVQVGDAVGNFMVELNSPTQWDLIIVAAEARSGVRGEFWDVILERVNQGSALIAEVWYLDDTAAGRISSLLGKCGIKYQRDWVRDEGADPLDYSMYWLDSGHELFSIYNSVGPLYTVTPYWIYDVGDLIRLGSGGDATLLAGLYSYEKSSYGTLATCLDGQMIFQTFSSHDYRYDQVVPLWQNYIMYTLTNHFQKAEE